MRYQIKQWSKLFETGKTRTVINKSYGTYPLKNGIGYNRLLARPDGHNLYGKFMLLVSLCHSQAPEVRDGWLTGDGKPDGEPLDAEDMYFKFGGSVADWNKCLETLSNPANKICWLLAIGAPGKAETQDLTLEPAEIAPSGPSLEQQAEQIYSMYPRKVAKPKALAAITKAIQRDGEPQVYAGTKCYAGIAAEYSACDRKFIPYPATFFNQERYKDAPETFERPQEKPRVQSEGFKTAGERKSVLDYWIKRYIQEKNGGRAKTEAKARDKYGERFANDMVSAAAKKAIKGS